MEIEDQVLPDQKDGLEKEVTPRRALAAGVLFTLFVIAVLVRAVPLVRGYFEKLTSLHGISIMIAVAIAGGTVFLLLGAAIRRAPRSVAGTLCAVAAVLTVTSGNALAFLIAAAILFFVLLIGDAVSAAIRSRDAERPEEIPIIFGSGVVSAALTVLILGEAGILRWWSLVLVAAAVSAIRHGRVLALLRLLASPRLIRPRTFIESLFLAFVAGVLIAVWALALSPDIGWDSLAYHLPEARDIAMRHVVRPLPALAPQTLFWRNQEAFGSLGFFFGGEGVVRFLHFFTGLGAFGAALVLAGRVGASRAKPLVVLSLAAYPFAVYQMRAFDVDWAAAFLVTVAAAAIAGMSDRTDLGNVRLGAFLFGGAIGVKILAIFAAPALLILLWRRAGIRPKTFAIFVLFSFLPLAPWFGWGQRHSGSFLQPYASSFSSLAARATSGYFFVTPSTPSRDAAAHEAESLPPRGLRNLLLLPFSLTYHSSRFEAFRDGYGGVLALLLLPGVAGLGWRRFSYFIVAAGAAIVPWYLMHEPSSRYLLPLYPLYAVFAAGGIVRMTRSFEGVAGSAAAISLLAAALAFPVQIGSTGDEFRVAVGLMSPDEAKARALPSYSFWAKVRPEDQLIFVGEFDLYHCRCERAYRALYGPVNEWESDARQWRRGMDEIGADWIVRSYGVTFPVEGLHDRLRVEAVNGPATLYRVLPGVGTTERVIAP